MKMPSDWNQKDLLHISFCPAIRACYMIDGDGNGGTEDERCQRLTAALERVEASRQPADGNSPLGTRMKRYEHAFRQVLPRRTYTLLRLDGRAFHSYLRHAVKPFDMTFVQHMNEVSIALCKEISGARFAYTQSDEVSLLITDFEKLEQEPYFGGVVAKLLSIPPSLASVVMHERRRSSSMRPQFDCRVWSMSDPVEVANYFIWRQRDAVRNSIQMVGQHYFSPAQLHGKNTDEVQEMLFSEHGVNWDAFPDGCKRGRVVVYGDSLGWKVEDAPHFLARPGSSLAQLIPELPSLTGT